MRLALRTQQVLAYETGICDTIDPLAGSYFVEALTDRIEADVQRYLGRIDELGGMVAAVKTGYVQQQIQEAAYRTQRAIDAGERVVVGVNRYTVAGERPAKLARVDPALRQVQIAGLAAVKKQRSDSRRARGARGAAPGSPQRGHEPGAADPRRGQGVREPRRDLPGAARRVRRAQGAGGALTRKGHGKEGARAHRQAGSRRP